MNSPSLIYVLVEGQRQKQLLYRFLTRAGFGIHQITIEMSPAGRGSAEQWVRENFARQAGKCRARNSRAATGMLIMIDADICAVQECIDRLDSALIATNQRPVDPSRDRIARLIPKRNVETWILWLSLIDAERRKVDEQMDYKPAKTPEEWSALISPASDALEELTKPGAPLSPALIDSLRSGLQEIPRALSVR